MGVYPIGPSQSKPGALIHDASMTCTSFALRFSSFENMRKHVASQFVTCNNIEASKGPIPVERRKEKEKQLVQEGCATSAHSTLIAPTK